MMLDDFIQHTLAQVDDLAELKVTLVAMRLLELKESETASITASELATHPSLRDGLGFAPQIAMDAALQRALARGTLLRLVVQALDEPRYFLSNNASRTMIEAIELAESKHEATRSVGTNRATHRTLIVIEREIERQEMIDVYPANLEDEELIEEWLAQGYTQADILRAVREALGTPRPKGNPARTLSACSHSITTVAPGQPSSYYRSVVSHMDPPPDAIIAFRELAGRWPIGHEYNLAQAAVGIFGANAAIQMMRHVVSTEYADMDSLLPRLAEQEEAELALARAQAIPDLMFRELIQLYETTFGLPPTSRIAQDINALAAEIKDIAIWHSVFEYASAHNKREWAYIRKLLVNPSPSVFEPQPINETARYAFNEYKRRISRTLDPSVAREMNNVAQLVTDQARWAVAFDKAASANALNWNYMRKVLTGSDDRASEVKDGRRKQIGGGRQRGVTRRPQVEESTAEEREAAYERARQRIAERAKRRSTADTNSGDASNGTAEQP